MDSLWWVYTEEDPTGVVVSAESAYEAVRKAVLDGWDLEGEGVWVYELGELTCMGVWSD